MINLNDTTPSAPSNTINIKWQVDGSGNVSGNAPSLTPSGAGHQAGFAPDPGGSAGITRFLREDATWQVPSGGGGGGVTTGTPVVNLGNQPPVALGPLGTGQSMILKMPGRSLQCLPTTWKLRIQRGAGSHFSAIVVLQTNIDSLTVLGSTAVLFGGSATPTMSAGLNLSDAISVTLDPLHDLWIVGYNDSGDSSFWGLKPAVEDGSSTLGIVGGYITGDQTAVSPVAGGSIQTGFGCPWDAVLAG